MSNPEAPQETEIKLAIASADEARRLLEAAGFHVLHERAFEANTVFDTVDRSLITRRCLLRLRSFRGESILTFKGAPEPGPHKSRAEYETSVADAGILAQVLVQLGFGVVFRYEKYRTTYARGEEPGHAVLDETPIGVFLELEGAPDWIDATARAMGFNHEDYILESYGSLYRAWCERRGVEPAHMVFAEAAGEGTLE